MTTALTIDRIDLHVISLPYVHPFETSFGRETHRTCILAAVHANGLVGWGECVAGDGPWYSYETVETAWHVLTGFLIPELLGRTIDGPADVVHAFRRVRGHPMARATLENAVWDLRAQADGISLQTLLGGSAERVAVGVSVGIEASVDELVARVADYVNAGYARVKLKIKPGFDLEPVSAVRERWPDLLLQVDANSAYTLADLPMLRALDAFSLLLIEQPFHHDDMVDHARLQQQMQTPICLDESIQSTEHARWALELGACRTINIKVGRVGGLTAAREIHDLCAAAGVPVWCGGMLETNVGRALNLALASLPNFRFPGDISASTRYYHQDIALPNFTLNADSTIDVPSSVGLGVAIQPDRLAATRLRFADYRVA